MQQRAERSLSGEVQSGAPPVNPWPWCAALAVVVLCVAPIGLLWRVLTFTPNYELVELADGHSMAGRYAKALEAYEEVYARDPAYGDPPYYACLGVAECREKLGDTSGALEAVDTAIAGGARWHAFQIKARLLERTRGQAAAIAFFDSMIKRDPPDSSLLQMLGDFHTEAGREEKGASAYLRAIKVANDTHGFTYDAQGWLIESEATRNKENDDFASLSHPLERASNVLLRLSRDDEALVYATMGVSIGQELKRLAGYYSPEELEAGDADCRVTRAFVFMRRGELKQAAAEIKHARVIADGTPYVGWKRSVRHAQAELDRARAARSE